MELTLIVNNSSRGTIDVEPNESGSFFCPGTEITLTAEPNAGESFRKWKIFDPNHPGDANYVVEDTNTVIQLTMSDDWEVRAVFECGSGMPPVLPMTLCVLALYALARRRA